METDDEGNAARPQTVVEHPVDRRFKLLQFVIDRDPQRLEDARCGMTPEGVAPG